MTNNCQYNMETNDLVPLVIGIIFLSFFVALCFYTTIEIIIESRRKRIVPIV